MLATLRAIDSRSGDCGNDGLLLCDQLSSLSSRKFRRDEITTLIRPAEIIRDLQRIQMLATLRAIDSRSGDCGNDGLLLCDQLSSLSSRKFHRGEITTLIRPAEIIRDL
jgi:mRNA-degrading endonuclease toxin of MazEF toxin-antitoxin module